MLLDPQFIQQLDRLELQNRRTLAGTQRGERRSRRTGPGLDFADYRHYVPGDDLRHIDWNLYARLDRLFVKIFHEEQDLQCHVLLDASRSMDFGDPNKLAFARRLAAAVGYIAVAGQDKLTLSAFTTGITERFGPARGRHQLPRLCQFLEQAAGEGATSLEAACRELSQRVRARAIILLVSDFMDPAWEPALRHLVRERFEVYAVQVLSPQELEPPMSGHLELVDSESGERMEVTLSPRLRQTYRRHLDGFCATIQTFCTARGIVYLLARSDAPIEQIMMQRLRKAGLVKG